MEKCICDRFLKRVYLKVLVGENFRYDHFTSGYAPPVIHLRPYDR